MQSLATDQTLKFHESDVGAPNTVRRLELLGKIIPDTKSQKIVNSSIDFTNVDFTYWCKVKSQNKLNSDPSFSQLPMSIKELTVQGLNRFAAATNCYWESIPIYSAVVDYQLTQDTPSLTGFRWHRDFNGITMTTVLNTASAIDAKFTGGDLLFGHSLNYPEFKTKVQNEQQTVANDSLIKMPYRQNSALLFDNLWSEHCVSDIHTVNTVASGEIVHRYLFSVFANPSKRQMTRILHFLQSKNLAKNSVP